MPLITPRQAALSVSEALATIVMIDGAIDKGADHPNYHRLIEETFANAQKALDLFWATLCDDEQDPDINDAEVCLLMRHRQNQAAEEPPEQPDPLARKILERAGVML